LLSFDFAFGWACTLAGKSKCEQCAAVEKLKNKKCAVAKNKTSLRWLSVQSGVGCYPCCCKNVRSKHKSFKLAGCQ
jgi:hypothetical protein